MLRKQKFSNVIDKTNDKCCNFISFVKMDIEDDNYNLQIIIIKVIIKTMVESHISWK